MARKRSPILTEAELRIMKILWEKGSATVKELVEGLPKNVDLAYTTILTTLQYMQRKGLVRHEEPGRAYVYYPLVEQREARRSAVRFIVNRFFEDSPELLVLNILEHEKLSQRDINRLKKLLDEDE